MMSKPQPVRQPIDETVAPSSPFPLFAEWWQEASTSDLVYEHNAMTLATVGSDGAPSARIVLMRKYDETGFCFYTNYDSRKGRELAANTRASLLFWWGALGRQVRIEGHVARLSAAESDAYYHSRPLGSRLGAWISPQSQVIASRTLLEEGLQQLTAQYADHPPPRPANWGGYRVAPAMMEFWQSGPHRLHDRLCYTRQSDGSWTLVRLAP
jgi:pyridoxamine 5'-phosphate oxidase